MVETTGITGNYRNDLLTLETGYLEPRCWYPFAVLGGAASKYSNERCNNRLSLSRARDGRLRYIARNYGN